MKKDGLLTLRIFSNFPKVVHGFSTHLPFQEKLVITEQVHGAKVKVVDRNEEGERIKGVDGLVTSLANTYLTLHTADCLPILFYDPQCQIIAACHAGWKGTLREITKETVGRMEKLGSDSSEVMVGIGPHIKVCCYNVSRQRAELFKKKFGRSCKMLKTHDQKFYLDLTYLNLKQLEEAGVENQNIEVAPYCTFCSRLNFPSFRRQGKLESSQIWSVIGRKK